ncbi:hypothetical protein O6H91_02G071100 [Diphasiastrum complanatum]|uniref:Uncharacterized protein n=1 Tax=Diphasiastrum complanatum TaxID=34168 RepID=A0ACC2EGS2_DIPCM|nr:hypothetical protein O6H91_02G071100 [Diphasiastrum complanatum]
MAEAASAVESSGSLGCLPRPIALAACAALAILYVALLYVPSLLPGLPRRTPRDYMLHRFVSAAVASVIAPILAFTILPVRSSQKSGIHLFLKTFGLRTDYVLQASIYSLLLTATLYLGPLTMEISDILHVWKEETGIASIGGDTLASTCSRIFAEAKRLTLDVFAWRNYVVAPISEELVFRACMTPILLCGSFSLTLVVFISPTFFSSAHIHHFVELVYLRKYQKYRAALSVYNFATPRFLVGMQLFFTCVQDI